MSPPRTEFSLRRVCAADAPAVFEIARQAPAAAQWTRDDFRRACAGAFDGWVAEFGGKLVGFLFARLVDSELEILNLAAEAESRRRGIGSALLAAALHFGRQAGTKRVFLEVRASNAEAIAFYNSHGFTPSGRRPRYYANPVEDALILSRPLVADSA